MFTNHENLSDRELITEAQCNGTPTEKRLANIAVRSIEKCLIRKYERSDKEFLSKEVENFLYKIDEKD